MADSTSSAPSNLSSASAVSSAGADEETDWPSQITSSIVGYIDQVRDKTTKPALMASRAVVFGLLILMFIPVALVLLLVGMLRLVEIGFRALYEGPFDWSGDHAVWSSYLTWGLLLFLGGVFLFRKRKVAA